jgi:hypothetical protein
MKCLEPECECEVEPRPADGHAGRARRYCRGHASPTARALCSWRRAKAGLPPLCPSTKSLNPKSRARHP